MIYAHADARRLAAFRIAVFAVWIVHLVLEPFPELAAMPREWFTPCGPWLLVPDALLRALWNEGALQSLRLATLGCVALALIGAPRPRLWSALAAGLLTCVASFVRGFGHVDHAEVQLLLLTIALCCLPAWDALCVSGASQRRRVAPRAPGTYATSFAVLAIVFGFPYFLTAAFRLTHEGIAIFTDNSMPHFVARDSLMLDHLDFTFGLRLLEYPAWLTALQLGFAATTLAELAAPWAFLRRSWCVSWLLVIVPFHLFAPLLMHVLFAHNLAALALLYAWPLTWQPLPLVPPRSAGAGPQIKIQGAAREKHSTSPIDCSS